MAMRRMNTKLSISICIATGLVGGVAAGLLPERAESHHSFAMYDQSKTETLTGRVTRFIPGANHAQLLFELVGPGGEPVMDENGERVVWGVETGPAARIAQQGVTVDAFPEGTVLTVTLNPLRDGRTFGSLSGAIVKCGMELPEDGCTPETGQAFMDSGN